MDIYDAHRTPFVPVLHTWFISFERRAAAGSITFFSQPFPRWRGVSFIQCVHRIYTPRCWCKRHTLNLTPSAPATESMRGIYIYMYFRWWLIDRKSAAAAAALRGVPRWGWDYLIYICGRVTIVIDWRKHIVYVCVLYVFIIFEYVYIVSIITVKYIVTYIWSTILRHTS